MTITTEQLKERAKFWREKVADGVAGTVVLEQGILMFAELFEELAEARELLAAREAMPVDFIPKNLDKALAVVGVAIPESREEFNFQTERYIQRLIDRVIRYSDEFTAPPAVPEAFKALIEHLSNAHAFIENTEAFGHTAADGIIQCGDAVWNIDESKAAMEACRAYMLENEKGAGE